MIKVQFDKFMHAPWMWFVVPGAAALLLRSIPLAILTIIVIASTALLYGVLALAMMGAAPGENTDVPRVQ